MKDLLKRCPQCHHAYWDDMTICPTCRCELIYDSLEQNIKECSQQNTTRNKTSPWGTVGVVTGLASCFLPFFISPYLAIVALVAGIVAIKSGQKKAGWLSVVLSAWALGCVIYVSTQIQTVLNGEEPSAISKKLGIKTIGQQMNEITASVANGKLKLLHEIKVKQKENEHKVIAYVKNVSGKNVENLSASFFVKDKNGNVLTTATEYLSSLRAGDNWKIVATTYLDYNGRTRTSLDAIEGFIK